MNITQTQGILKLFASITVAIVLMGASVSAAGVSDWLKIVDFSDNSIKNNYDWGLYATQSGTVTIQRNSNAAVKESTLTPDSTSIGTMGYYIFQGPNPVDFTLDTYQPASTDLQQLYNFDEVENSSTKIYQSFNVLAGQYIGFYKLHMTNNLIDWNVFSSNPTSHAPKLHLTTEGADLQDPANKIRLNFEINNDFNQNYNNFWINGVATGAPLPVAPIAMGIMSLVATPFGFRRLKK